jgi:hypothetical protein
MFRPTQPWASGSKHCKLGETHRVSGQIQTKLKKMKKTGTGTGPPRTAEGIIVIRPTHARITLPAVHPIVVTVGIAGIECVTLKVQSI